MTRESINTDTALWLYSAREPGENRAPTPWQVSSPTAPRVLVVSVTPVLKRMRTMIAQNKGYKDPEVLRRLYWVDGLSLWQIAQRFDVHQKTVWEQFEKYNIDRHGSGAKNTGSPRKNYATYRTDPNGYPRWRGYKKVDGFSTTFVHQLLAVADGADPHKVYDGCTHHIHHINGVKWDNRPENVELLTAKEHAAKHPERGRDREYTDQELLSWIDAFVEEVGHVPSSEEMNECPGPHSLTIANRFGSWSTALEKCGYEPRDGSRSRSASKYGYRASDKDEGDKEHRARPNNPSGMPEGEHDMSGKCPLCGDKYTNGLPDHLPCGDEK